MKIYFFALMFFSVLLNSCWEPIGGIAFGSPPQTIPWFTADVIINSEIPAVKLQWKHPYGTYYNYDFVPGLYNPLIKYQLERKSDEDGHFIIIATNLRETSFIDTEILNNNTYKYRITDEIYKFTNKIYDDGILSNSYGTQYTNISVSIEQIDFAGKIVQWQEGQPIEGSSVILTKENDSKFYSGNIIVSSLKTTTNSDGQFQFSNLYSGIYKMKFTKEGFADTLVQILGINSSTKEFITWQKPLNQNYEGSKQPVELYVKGIYPGFQDSGNTLVAVTSFAFEKDNLYYYYQPIPLRIKPLLSNNINPYGDLKLILRMGTNGVESFPIAIDSVCEIGSYDYMDRNDINTENLPLTQTGIHLEWSNSQLVKILPGNSLISLFVTGDDGSPLTHLSFPITLLPK